jgi:protein-S-isoprenylcysteine O-methyltransferase Ste14
MNTGPLVWSYLIYLAVFLIISVVFIRRSKGESARKGPWVDSALFLLVNVVSFILPMIYAFSTLFDGADYSLPNIVGIVGVIGLVVALMIKLKAHYDLGRNFTTEPGPKGELITEGIYAYVRHPLYLSVLIWGISTPLVIQNFIAGVIPLVCICLFIAVRVPIEERMLEESFEDLYRTYKAHTGKLLPRLGRKGHP